MSDNKNDWRSRVKSMMTDPNYAEKMASVVDDTRKVNTGLMNKSEEYESSLSLDKPTSQPLDLARVDEMKAEDAARATMPSEDDNYSGVSDLATKVYAEERSKRIGKALQRDNTYFGAPHGMRLSQAAEVISDVEKAKNVQGIYDKVLQDESVSQAIHTNANKALLKAMEANQSLSEEEQKKVYDDAVSKQLEAIGKGIDKYLYDINAPKSEAEWIAKNAVNSSIMGQMLTSPMNVEGGENAYQQQALADYGAKASWLSQGVSMAGSLIMDTLPMMGIGTAFAAPASKAAMWGVGKVGGKALQGSLIGRGIVGSVGGAATLGGYNAASTLTTQFSNGQFDLGEITSSAGHGALMGGLTGVMSPMLRGLSQGMGKVGKAATMAGGLGAEAGIFSAAELSEMENPYDFETIAQTFGKNVVVIGGLKLSNPIKTIGEYKRWYNEGKQSNFDDADYKMMADFAKAKGYANNEAFTMSADGVYSRSIADRVTGNRTLLELTKLEGGKERNLAIEMYNDPNVPISLKTKIAAKMNLPAPKPLLANGVRVEGNKAITYCTMPNGAQQVIEIKEFARPRNARAFANEFSRTTARKNDLMQTEAAVNNISTEPIVIARLNEQAKRNGTTYEEELARLNDIVQRAAEGTITAEDVAYYSSIVDTDISATEAIKQGIKDEYGVEIDDVLKSDGNLTDAQDKALTAYADALRGIVEQGNPTTERMLVASTSGVADYVALNRLGIEQTRGILTNPTQRAEIDAQMRSKYGAWLKYFDGKMGEDALAAKLGYDLNNSTDLQSFLAEQTYFKNKAADRIAANTTDVAKQLLEQGGRGVRFTEGGKVKLQGVPYPIEVSQDVVDRYDAAMQGSGEPMSRIVNDALKDIIKQSETPSKPEEPIMEAPDATEQPMTDTDAITQQMVDARLAEIDTDLQGIEADGVQRMTINGRPVAIIKGRIVADADGKVDKTKSSTEVAYMLLNENGRPILEDGKPKIEVGVKPSNVRVEDIEQWRSVDEYKAAEEQRIRDNNRLTDEAMQMANEEIRTEEMPVESKVEEITKPQTTNELVTLCKGDRELALDVAMDELNRAQQSKGKGANAAETMAINQRIRTYQRMVDDLSKAEEPTPTEAPTEQTTDTQVTDDMEFIYQKDLSENHDGMEPMQMADGRYKWVGLQRGELTATMGERDAELLDGLAKKLGVAVIPINVADSAVNGYYRDGNVYVNTNRGADWTMRWVAGHEMLHDVAKKSPEAYDAYKQAVLNMWDSSYIDNQVKQIIDDYAASGKTIDREQALTELVNDFGGELFNSRDGLSILDNILKGESRKGNTGFVETIKQWWDKIKEWFGATPYYNEAQKMLEQAYKDAMENVDYKAREEQLSKDMDDAFFGETDVVKPKEAEVELKETKDFTPTKMPSGTTIENKPSGDFSVKSIMRGVGIDAQTDGDNVWFERGGKRYSKDMPMTIEESKSGILKDMVDQCVELGLMDEAKSKDVYKMYTGIVNKIIEKADGSFADLNNQYLWLGETVYRVVHSNSDKQYKRSLDVTLVCKKNEAVIRSISELQRRQGFGVTPAQIMQLYYSTLEKGYQVPCPVCYVFSRYIQNGQYTSNLIYGHHKFDNDSHFRNPAEMTPEEKAEAEAYWLKKYKEALRDEKRNKKLIDACKFVMSYATKEMDNLMREATSGSNKLAKRNEYEKRAVTLDAYYRAAINLIAKADMSGYIKSVIAKPVIKNDKVVGMEMRKDAGQKMTPEVEEVILDYRKVALAKTKYPHISRYIASKGSAAGKGYNFESDNPMGDVLQQLLADDKNYYQKAMDATTDKEKAESLDKAKERTKKSAHYAARQTLRGGIRQWSWSDNIEALAPDVALNAMQVGMLGGAMQTYSKQLEGIEMMAAMNAYVNGSLMGKGMGYQKVSADFNAAPKWQDPKTGDWYSLHFDDVVGVQPYNRNGKLGLFALNEMYDRAGNILVGMNDIHIRTAMADPRIFFIIPWHASGMSDHILKQMNSMLKLDMAGFKASDYTKHQEEKMYENKVKKQKDENGVEIEVEELAEIPESTTQLWQSHDYSEKFLNRDGTQPKIELADDQLSADQLHYRELRDAALTHSTAENASDKDKAFWAEHQDWLAEIKNDIFLNQVLESVTNGPGRFGIAMTTEDCGFVYPYEYWDKASTYDGADINGQRYVEYCRRLGVKPKFSGIDGKAGAYGNFVDDSGYWKLLIDRRMYDREGNYQDLTPVDISGFKADFIDQDKTAARFPVTVVADKKATSDIVDDVQYNELKVYNDNPLEVDYEQTIKEALKEAKKAEEKYIKAKQAIQTTKTGKQKVINQSELYKLELDRLAKQEALADVENDNFLADEGAEMSIVRDRNKVEELENEELVPMFRTFQILDDALYSPMATVQRGEKVHSVAKGDWWKSDENPDLAKVRVKGSSTEFYDKDDDRISKKDGQWVITIDGEDKPLSANGNALSYYFLLKKGEKGDVVDDELYAAYNPYIHASRSSLNDQFKGAYLRPNLVLVEVLVPKSEIDGTNRYKADYAKDGIGEVDWNSGSVIKQAVAAGHPGRKVALSRYAKIGKVFTDAEWAQKIDEELSAYKGQITLPFVAFPPEVLRELANMGYKVEPPTSKKAQPYYKAWLNGEEPTDPNGGGEYSIKSDKQKQFDIISSTNPMRDDYHTGIRKVDDILTLQEAIDASKQENGEDVISTYPDVDESVYNEALQSGKIKVYSSKPIENGAFVGPSMMQAKDYAGGGKVYSKEVNVSDIAWINADEGVYANLGKQANESVLDYAKRVSKDADYSIKGGKSLDDRLESKYTQTRLRAARELAGDDESALMILDDLEPQTLEEYVAEQLGANGRKLLWENGKFSKGLKAHLGVSENEKKTYRSIISKDGYPPEVLAEEIWKSMPEEFYERYTDQDVFNTILDLASSYTRKQLKDFVVNRRIDAVIEFARKQEEWDAAQEEMYLETLSEQERNAYLANKEEMERVGKMSKKERAEYYKQKQVEQMLGEMTPEERAEYEAKEQWRKDNAAAITSSFFAERRLDKADKIQKLKDEINNLIKETRATNKENSEKVKEIAKEMQSYIKENIPTETQGDMTRPQFEQVIKQLSNAITRKDLEKPMRMVEYIGANTNRRALTRQMRDFLKQGFKGMTPKGLVKAKNVDGATSRVLGLAKSLYESMGKQPLGSDLHALQTKVRGIKAELEDLNNANGGAFSEYVEQINAILKKSGVDRYEEMTKYYNELSDRQDVGEIQVTEVLDHINRMLPELFSIELVKEQRTQAKADSAMTTKEDLEQLRNNLEDKREKGILSEEDQAVLDNMAMYELMVNLQQRQLDIDGPGTSSIASQMAAKVKEAKQYRDELEKYDDKKSGIAKNLKDNIKRVNAEMEELFVQRTQAQKEVNANVAELLDNLKQLRDTGNSVLKEWSKNKQERETRIVNMANASFGKDARGYWSEVDRRGGWKRDFSNKINNLRLAALMSPALSFEYMVGVMDPRYYTNESPIYKQFIKGEDGLIKANDNFFEGLEAYNNGINEAVERFINRNAMQSLKEYFNRGDRFATEIIPFEFEVKENVNGEVVTSIVHRDAEMTRGRAAKIYAWSRMADGMAKLKAHGVTDETLEVVKAFIGQDYMDFIDWVEDEYFPKLRREKYNPIYKQMYGISMAENEHYFPFETYKKDIRTEKELEQINSDNLGGGIVGNIIERKRNNARLDFTDESPDIFDAISEYGRKMEEWAAYAQVREDLKKVINNKQFKQHCDMLGTNYYNHFLDAARVASRLYNPQPSAPQLQTAAAKLQKVFASAAISLRVSTALKQLLSAPAFAVYSLDPAFHKELLKTASVIDVESAIKGLRELAKGNKAEAKRLLLEENWVGHYNWCVNNLPSFRERVSKGGAGNPILEEKGWSKFSDDVQSVGMLPNRLVDAFTCSVGAKAIYEYAFNKYKKTYDEATAHNMAVTDAEIAFNSSQQSSNPVFLSPLQSSKEFWLRGIMNYKNSPIGYYRAGMKANIDLYRATKALFGKPKFTINGEQVGFEGNGVNPAAKAAEAAAKSIMFNFFLNYLWAFGTIGIAGVSHTMMNNDNEDGNLLYTDEEFDKATGGNMGLAVFNAATQGIPWISGFASVSQTGQDYTPSILFSEMNNYLEQVNKEGFMSLATAQLLIDLGLKNAIGVDPEVWGQIYRGAQGIMADRPLRSEDFMNLLASPRSAIAGVAKQKVGEYDNMKDYVDARIESEREIGINETMDLGKKLTGLRPLRKSKLDGYIDEYLADKIPDYRELANKPDEKAKEERMEESNAFKNLNTLVATVQHTEEKRKSSKKIDGNEETKDKVKKIRKAVNVIHKLYASGDASLAQRIADELERRLKRGYNENGATLDDKLKNVDIYDSTGTTEQRGNDGFDTMFDRAMLGGFDGVYLGSKLD